MSEEKLYDFQQQFEEDKQKIPPISTFAKASAYDGRYPIAAQNTNRAFYLVSGEGNPSFVYPPTSSSTGNLQPPLPANMVGQSSMMMYHRGGTDVSTSGTLPPTPPVSADEKDHNIDDPNARDSGLIRMLSQTKQMELPSHLPHPPHLMMTAPQVHLHTHTHAPGPISPMDNESFDGEGDDPFDVMSHVRMNHSKRRSTKKAVTDDMKDHRYFERRKKNNMAAKRSRDARKYREEQISHRASYLERENAHLRSQLETLKEEAYSLRQLLAQKSNSS